MKLATELVSLIHHIELNKVGWWDVAIQRLILAAMWIFGENLTVSEIIGVIDGEFRVSVNTARVEAQVKYLRQSDVLLAMPNGRHRICERSLKAFESDIQGSDEMQIRVKDKFVDSLRRCCPALDPDETWQEVSEHLFIPAIQVMGSRFYSFVSGHSFEIDEIQGLRSFLSRYSDDVAPSLRSAVTEFLSQDDSDIRSYVLCYLRAYFFLEAGNLSDDTIRALNKTMTQPPSFRIFADTNFIFSVLGIHSNPSDEDAQTVLELEKQLTETVKVQLYVLPPTLEETRQAIQWRVDESRDLQLTPNVAVASLRRRELGGFIRKFAEEARKLGQPLSVEDYYGPYVTNLLQIIRAKGIELYNADVSHYRMSQAVINDVTGQLGYEQKQYGDAAKTYERLEHDVVLWHFVHDQRSQTIESPLDAEYWIVTIDYRFLGFDAYKIGRSHEQFPVCLHPSTLIQLLQFWVPRTSEFEEMLYGSWLWPLLFHEVDPEMERATIRILKTLARFEDIGDIPTEVLDHVLVNQALRQRMSSEREIASQIELVKDALIQETRRVAEELETARREAKEKESQIVEQERQIRDQDQIIESQKQKVTELEQRLKASNRMQELLSNRLTGLEEKTKLELERKERSRFVVGWIALPIVALFLIGAGISYGLDKWLGWDFWKTAIATWGILVVAAICLTDHKGSSNPVIAEHHIFKLFHRFRKWLLGTVIAGVSLKLLVEAIVRFFSS